MNIAVIGLGSMGKRRIKLIREMYPSVPICGVDGREDRREEAASVFGIPCFDSISALPETVDAAFVCTSPLSHNSIIRMCLLRGCNVFTELNLVADGYEENMKLAEERGAHLFLSSTFLYREEIKYIRSRIRDDKKWNYIYHIGQYLPDWHPWENYKDFFVGDARTNGCREIFAIEMPWLMKTFGEVDSFHVVADKMTDLQISYPDNFIVQLTHKNGNKGVLIVDIVSPCAVRKFEAYSEGAYLKWDGTPEQLYECRNGASEATRVMLKEETEHRDGYRAFIVENAYKNEIRAFFNLVENGEAAAYDFAEDLKLLSLLDRFGA